MTGLYNSEGEFTIRSEVYLQTYVWLNRTL